MEQNNTVIIPVVTPRCAPVAASMNSNVCIRITVGADGVDHLVVHGQGCPVGMFDEGNERPGLPVVVADVYRRISRLFREAGAEEIVTGDKSTRGKTNDGRRAEVDPRWFVVIRDFG